MLTSIIILTYNQLDYTKKCIESVRKYTTKDTYELIIVDNNSTDGTVEWLKSQQDISVIFNKENLGFPKGCNQGIQIANGDNILLLNNDTVVTHNWLENLLKCLYSRDDIGAVGPVTNNCSNCQFISVPYSNDFNSLEKMHKFAKTYNISNPLQWEERLRLIGFCYLVKREVVEKVGLLDEIFTPGNFEDDDYSFRIRKAGYKLLLCKDTFIHHFGGTSFNIAIKTLPNLIPVNAMKFLNKWNVPAEYFMRFRKDITGLIKNLNIPSPNILHIECGAGGSLLDIKNEIPNANLYGIESNSNAVVNTEHFAKIDIAELESVKKYENNFFDFIIFTLQKHDINYYLKILEKSKRLIKDSGHFLFIIPKDSNIIDQLINSELIKLFNQFSYKIYETYIDNVLQIKIEDKKSLLPTHEKICFIFCVNDKKMYEKSKTYIENLDIPKGYEIEFICKENSEFITKAYNEAMQETDAKYKIYIHQDVYIINNNFIKDFLDIFKKNKKIGMIGVAGAKSMPENGIWWESQRTYGKVLENHTSEFQLLSFNKVENNYENVCVIDGLIMITQYDIPWREDIFDGWHFYDASQSAEFIKAGYQVVIPRQHSPWCIHDCGIVNTTNYEKYRRIYVNEYINTSNTNITKTNNKKRQHPRFVTLLPGIQNVHLIKDVGMIPYNLNKYFNYDSIFPVYRDRDYPFLNNEVSGLKLDFLQNTGDPRIDGYYYLLHNARKIDILQVYNLIDNSFNWIQIYKSINPNGKVYLKLDADKRIKNINYHAGYNQHTKNLIEQCDLISVESKHLQEYLNNNWGLNVEYIPNGFYSDNYDSINYVDYEEKENVICTVGRIGNIQKATEILLEAFSKASPFINDWKLKLIGPIEDSFNQYIKDYFKKYPQLEDKIIFTGEISDRKELENEYRKAKIFCLSSRWESFGIVLAEAISNGCYIITSNIVTSSDITDNGKYGDVFEIDNIDQLSNLLKTNCNDENKLKDLVHKIQEHAYDKFNWKKICKKIYNLLQ